MKLNKILALIFIVSLLLPNYLFFIPVENAEAKSDTKLSTPQLSESDIVSSMPDTETSFIQQSDETESTPQPDPPSSITGDGAQRVANPMWNETQYYLNCDNETDILVPLSEGKLYHETLNFTRIEAINLTMSIEEDYTWYQYPVLSDMPFFMSFRVNGSTPVRLDGFWIELYTGAYGTMDYTIYNATSPTDSGATSKPHLSVSGTYSITVSSFTGAKWIWFDIDESSIILDPLATYQNAFYVAVWKDKNVHNLYWLGTDDNPSGDGVDEGDFYFDWTLDYYAEDYTLRVSIAPIDKFPSPTQFGLEINGTPVFDLGSPGIGWWENWPYPYPDDPGGIRYYNVSWLWPDYYQWSVTFDAIWWGTYFKTVLADSSFQVWVNHTTAVWKINFTAEFPSLSKDEIILVSIEEDWNIQEILYSPVYNLPGTIFSDWTEYDDYVLIFNARTGYWILQCEAPDYLKYAEVRNLDGEIITEANSTDIVTAQGYIQDPGGINATNGIGWLFAYDSYDYQTFADFNWVEMPPGGVVEINWSIWSLFWKPGVFTLHVIWSNGTEVGMNATTILVYSPTFLDITFEEPPPEKPVIRGEYVYIQVYYYDALYYPISNATVTVLNDTSGYEWGKNETGDGSPEYNVHNYADIGYPGYYLITLYTDNASTGVLHNITMHISEDLYEAQSYSKSFQVQTRATHIIFLQGYGLDNSTGEWRTSPEPYINDSSIQFTIKYVDDYGLPLQGANIQAYIIHGTVYKRLDWIDLSIGDPTRIGQYRITVDTNPIEGVAFHEGNVGFIIIIAQLYGYEDTRTDIDGPGMIYVQPQPRPSFIDVPSSYQEIELFANWTYEFPLRVILRDMLTGEDLSHGEIVAAIPEIGNVTLDLATPGLGLYEITNLTTNLSPGSYNITLYATAPDFVSCDTNVTLIIKPKDIIQFETIIDYLPQPPNFGATLTFTVRFFFGEGAFRGMVTNKNGVTPLPKGTEVTLEIKTTAGDYDPETLFLDIDGSFTYSILLDKDGGIYTFEVSIIGSETYKGLLNEPLMLDGDPLSVEVRSIQYYILGILPLVILVLAIFIGGFLSYRQFRLVPKRRIRLQKLTAIADTFSDVANLHRLLVIHKESGICVFDPFEKETKDATLVAGFLQAISTFGHDLGDTPGLADGKGDDAKALRELTYEGFRILIHDGEFVRNALVLTGTPSSQLRERLEKFTAVFEKRFQEDFSHWSGRVDQFNSASDLVEEIFLISLRLPHRVRPRRPRGVQLTGLESDIYKVAKEISKDREYIFLGQILSTYIAAAKRDKLEVLMAIYQLRQKGLLKPWQLDTAVLAATTAAPSESEADTESDSESDKDES
jgi:hypothetical protein